MRTGQFLSGTLPSDGAVTPSHPVTRPLATRWRLALTPPLSGAENMAVDLALMERAGRTGEAVFRVYTWATPTLSFGRNQTAIGRYALDRIAALGAEVVRRPTGGRAILHHREITYSVTAPVREGGTLRESYTRINTILLSALGQLGVALAIAAPVQRELSPTDMPCFAKPSAGEMTMDGRKLIGSAQWRDEHALLQHGSILVEDDQATLTTLMLDPPVSLPQAGTLREALGWTPPPDVVADAMFAAVRDSEDPEADLLAPNEIMTMARPWVAQFRDEQWTWRR